MSEDQVQSTDGPPAYGRSPRELLRNPRISAQAKALWSLLEDYTTPDSPQPFPGQETLAEYMGANVRTIRRWLTELEDAGWLDVASKSTPRGRHNVYTLRWKRKDRTPMSGGVRTSMSGGDRTPVSAEEEPVEEEPEEEKPSSQSDLQRDRADRWREERNRAQTGNPMVTDWARVLRFASQGQHRWSENPGLSPVARAAAIQCAQIIRSSTTDTARVAFFETWKQITAEGLTPMRESVA